jgi:coenzyme PQQ biosynthesis protein PqqD
MIDQSQPSLARGVRLQVDKLKGEPMLLFPEGAMYLSETAYEVVSRCDGSTTVAAIVSCLAEEYEASPETLRQDVFACLEELSQRRLLVL